jgi:uncharacterized protein YigE (DUF2233 family)
MIVFLVLPALASPPTHVRTVTHLGDKYVVATVDLRQTQLELFGQTDPTLRNHREVATHLEGLGRKLVVSANAGMFHKLDEPVGLHVEAGRELSPLQTREGAGNFYLKPNGVFWTDAFGAHVTVTEAWASPEGVRIATQSGPMMVIDKQVHPTFNPDSEHRFLRNAVGVSDPNTVHFVISTTGVRLHDMATLFRDVLACDNALYLDGAISTMWAEEGELTGGANYSGVLAVSVPKD